ncbi:hypothetical protein KC354_g5933 [Hortaea werneckii]|uniref:Zn(2)-C6 fungal-type domain-containing protein n=2 Tax=Hortaea werneckii TaxID=91943 RepID=A0A3M7CU17_HORWE|nr:hypothetical protein KC354_g5933 [Hortaea werneckii]RMY55503.1 hypothetical protein D0863_13289 [Hortaea werneckii]
MAVGTPEQQHTPGLDTTLPTPHGSPSATSRAPAPASLKRACDCCRKRKVKCDGAEPCTPCRKASIKCAYLQPPKKKGPKGLRSARVLHALRTIDNDASGTPMGIYDHQHQSPFGTWTWNSAGNSPGSTQNPEQVLPPPNISYPPPTSIAPEQQYPSQPMPTASATYQPQTHYNSPPQHQQPQQQFRPDLYRQDSHHPYWPPHSDLHSGPELPPIISPSHSEPHQQRLSGDVFLPYIQLFFQHMFPIMPVLDRQVFLDASLYSDSSSMSSDMYCFLCAICATTVVQLDASIPQPSPLHPQKPTDDVFAEECLRERKTYDWIDSCTPLAVMVPFFLFCYYGNHEQSAKAWHYLQECITFSENLNMDDEQSYTKLDPVEAQWRRRLYWLLFITERAYAVQRRKHTRLHASVQLPAVFESEDPQLLTGFVNLANLFSAVDDSFVSAWRGSRRQSLCNEAWLAKTQKQLDAAALAVDSGGGVSETQQMDISVTREWLHVLAWQMGVSNGLIWGKGEGGMRLDYPIEVGRRVVEITRGAKGMALDSHGIGMEQKLSDIAGCLADVLRCTAGDTSSTFLEGKQYLHTLLQTLSSMRGKESRYLKPLMSKLDGVMGYELSNATLPLPAETAATSANMPPVTSAGNDFLMPGGGRYSFADSFGMLRTLSMSGNLGMPYLDAPIQQGPGLQNEWEQRRESGRVYDEYETKAMGHWMGGQRIP